MLFFTFIFRWYGGFGHRLNVIVIPQLGCVGRHIYIFGPRDCMFLTSIIARCIPVLTLHKSLMRKRNKLLGMFIRDCVNGIFSEGKK